MSEKAPAASYDFWLKHDDDLRYISRVLDGAKCATEEDRDNAKAIVHQLRTLVRENYERAEV